ncbi:uncharacterized protein LOC131696631 isoform X1 [Acipenser ruthenus]|uniref:uncharacterized protein LOC131696631 isoform X1 n=1 Tax=Acipenser ruthenus TaxID=7906 RepID=UPI002740F7B7|nr:uncharacterized protein LOC131696631 isoform X1 [Acipenser ruthenus]
MRYITEGASLKEEEKKVKNKWRWAWLDEQDSAGRQFRGWCRKISEAGVCYCIVCNKTIVYGGNGKKVLVKHANCDRKHAAKTGEIVTGKLSVPDRVSDLKLHVTVLRAGELPALKRCSQCCQLHHCPFCKPSIYKPRDRYNVRRHLGAHLKRAVQYEGYSVCKCNLDCRPAGHFHCISCSKTLIRRQDIINHLSICHQKQVQGAASTPHSTASLHFQAPSASTPHSTASLHFQAPSASTPHSTASLHFQAPCPVQDVSSVPLQATRLHQGNIPPSEEVTEAACSLICDWAERILKRSFDTVVEIARFLIQEHIVNPRSSTAHIIMSASLAENPARPDKRPRIEEESSSAQRTKRKKSEADNMHFFSQIQIPASPKSAARRQRNGTSQQNLGTACPSPLTLLPREPVVPIVTGNTPLTREPAVPIITGNSPLTPQQHPLPTRSRASLPCSETAAGIHHPTGGLRDCEAQSWACEGWATQWRSRDPTEAGSEEPEHERTGNLPPPCGRELSDIIEVIIQDDRGAGALRPASAGNTEAAQRETIDLTAESP